MEFVLIWIILSGVGASPFPATGTAIFTSKDRCEVAAAQLASGREQALKGRADLLTLCTPR